jgi:hypothetical protein
VSRFAQEFGKVCATNWPLWVALLFTIAFGSWVFGLAFEVTIQEPYRATRWEHFLHGRPNELGDALAGFVGSLTLIWVVASVFQQSMELKAQRREFAAMSGAMQSQVQAMEQQTLLLKEDRRRREQDSAGEVLKELLDRLAHEVNAEATTASLLGPNLHGQARYRVFSEKLEPEQPFDFLLRNKGAITAFWDRHDGEFGGQVKFFRGDISLYGNLVLTIDRIFELDSKLSEEVLVRLERLELDSLKFDLECFLTGDQWHDDAHDKRNFQQ